MKISQSPGQIATSNHLVKSFLSHKSAENGLKKKKKNKKKPTRKGFPQKGQTKVHTEAERNVVVFVSPLS